LTQFTDLGLAKPLLQALAAEGYDHPTPIQAQAIPGVMAGRDLLGIAQTGTGKTAAFALPILHRLHANPKRAPRRGCRVLVLSPTRELATQIGDSFRAYGARMGVTVAVVFGGVKPGQQIRAMENGVDVLVATPGRLLDHMGTKHIQLDWTEILVLDEADQMLDLGFVVPIRKVVSKLPKQRQNLFFSATMPSEIGKLAGELLHDPLKVQVTPVATTAERVNQKILFVEADKKRELLAELIEDGRWSRTIVFTRTKRGADGVAKFLLAAGIEAASIHGDKSQAQRERALAEFKTGKVRVLVATDIAARGIDIDAVSHVVNYELPNVPEAYVHRIGRTARAGAEGSAVSLCADDERPLLRDIQKLTRQTIDSQDRRRDPALAIAAKAYAAAGVEPAKVDRPHGQKDGQQQRGGRGRPQAQGQRQGQAQPRPQGESRPQGQAKPEGQPKKGQPHRNRRRGRGGGRGQGDTAGLDKTLARQS
jgi:ATP-dependent RNA helicase RhlE